MGRYVRGQGFTHMGRDLFYWTCSVKEALVEPESVVVEGLLAATT